MISPKEKPLFSNKELWNLMIPLVIEMALTLLVGMMDSIMVSSAGEAAVSGVSLVDTLMQLLIYVFAALATGGAVVAGQYLGNQKVDRARDAAGQLIWFSGLLSVLIAAAVLISKDMLLQVLFGKISIEVHDNADTYLMIVACSIPAIAIYEAGAAIFRTMGNSGITMRISLIMNVLHTIGNATLIYGFSMGTKGAAISTLISRTFAAVMITLLLLNKNQQLHIEKTFRYRFDRGLVKKILGIGVPNGIENGMFQLGKIMLLSLVAAFGTTAITANAVAQTIASIQVIPGSAIQLGIVTVISRCVGAKNYKQAKYYNRKLLISTYVALVVFDTLILGAISPILSLYHLSADTVKLTKQLVLCHTIGAIVIWPLTFDLPSSMRAAGDVKFAMIISVISMWVFRIGSGYLFAKFLSMGVLGIWIAMTVDWAFRAVVFSIRWLSGKWKDKSII
ncbi:MATE family efflux transporter [Anaerocolumna xylanovorans]|uniref:Probable multidrug resistance protein NorM n=1 Tax=Anaerocolumna xylanovorans DSM 12503 TaxID=1121345 RepID=A0A1M7YID6_9FIRM|nr:MATE family efflux transporter [Anaerocolumna xylanovorans]SHO52349.1 putative efflux protein, MATE family [Anaerocolumna xylanovorans DSM 12503]